MLSNNEALFFSLLLFSLFLKTILNSFVMTQQLVPWRGEIIGLYGTVYWLYTLIATGFSDQLIYPATILIMAATTIVVVNKEANEK